MRGWPARFLPLGYAPQASLAHLHHPPPPYRRGLRATSDAAASTGRASASLGGRTQTSSSGKCSSTASAPAPRPGPPPAPPPPAAAIGRGLLDAHVQAHQPLVSQQGSAGVPRDRAVCVHSNGVDRRRRPCIVIVTRSLARTRPTESMGSSNNQSIHQSARTGLRTPRRPAWARRRRTRRPR